MYSGTYLPVLTLPQDNLQKYIVIKLLSAGAHGVLVLHPTLLYILWIFNLIERNVGVYPSQNHIGHCVNLHT